MEEKLIKVNIEFNDPETGKTVTKYFETDSLLLAAISSINEVIDGVPKERELKEGTSSVDIYHMGLFSPHKMVKVIQGLEEQAENMDGYKEAFVMNMIAEKISSIGDENSEECSKTDPTEEALDLLRYLFSNTGDESEEEDREERGTVNPFEGMFSNMEMREKN